MVVTPRCFPFHKLIRQAQIEKCFELKTRQIYFIYLFPPRLKLGKSLQTCYVNFFGIS